MTINTLYGPGDNFFSCMPFLRHVTSNIIYDLCMFHKFVNFVPIDLKIGTHIDGTYTMYLAKHALIKIT